MKWIKIKIRTSREGLGIAEEIFGAAGLLSLEIEDGAEFIETLEATRKNWDFVEDGLYEEKKSAYSVSAYTAKDDVGEYLNICSSIESECKNRRSVDTASKLGEFDVFFTELDEEDWAENWKKYFKPIPIGENLLICPTWEKVPNEYAKRTVFYIDPGMSFGTGTHETTRLTLAAVEKYQKCGDITLDLGCGSGILFVSSLLLGAAESRAVDIDANSVRIAAENAELNNISKERYTVFCGDLLQNRGLFDKLAQNRYDIIMMNIVPDIIIPVLPYASNLLADRGKILMSGIIERYLGDIYAAIEKSGLKALEIADENGWYCVVCGKEKNKTDDTEGKICLN